MFTGIVLCTGRVVSTAATSGGVRLVLEAPLGVLELGESVCVDGACLTVAAFASGGVEADLSTETLERTTLGRLVPGTLVNLERSLTLADRLGGHLVTGHVDGIARIARVAVLGETRRVDFECPRALARFVAEKGSVALSGVSLTVNAVSSEGFSVMLIPHTLSVTTLSDLTPGRALNLEVDLVARYVARWVEGGRADA